MSHEYLYEVPSKWLDIKNHPQPDFKNQLRWWKRTSLGWIAPTINSDEWIMLDALKQMVLCGELGVNFDEANRIMDAWDKWEMDAEKLVREYSGANLTANPE